MHELLNHAGNGNTLCVLRVSLSLGLLLGAGLLEHLQCLERDLREPPRGACQGLGRGRHGLASESIDGDSSVLARDTRTREPGDELEPGGETFGSTIRFDLQSQYEDGTFRALWTRGVGSRGERGCRLGVL